MSAPPVPPPFEHLGNRPFSFFPSIVGIEHNEWRYGRATWSEVLVVNTKTNEELWVARRYLGELARIEEPTMIWGLTKELEYRAGSLVPHVRRVIEMPRAVNDIPRPAEPAGSEPAPVVGIRMEPSNEARIGRLVAATLLLGITGTAIFVGVYRHFQSGKGVVYRTIMQSSLGLSAQDDYFAVTRKLGTPMEDRWRDSEGQLQYRLLRYPDKFVILMGRERNAARYIGALDVNWRVIDSVELPGAVKTYSMLAKLPRF